MYKCIIIDDEELARRLIKNHLNNLNDFEIVASCSSAIEAVTILQKEAIDLIFLDIEMPLLKGIDFFKSLVDKPKLIFTTAHREYAIDGFELNAIDYLLKPISFNRFFNAITKFLAQQEIKENSNNNFIFVRKDRKQVKVFFNDILYVESIKDYIKIHLTDKNHVIKHSLTSFENLLDKRFIRTHRSYIVNKDKITAYTKHDVEIDSLEIPISNNYKNRLSLH